jgi:hypothetical protein
MISSITTSTVDLLSTVSAYSATLIATLTLVVLLLQKEIGGEIKDVRARRLSKLVNAAIVPLLVTFVTTVISRVAEVLQ